VKRQPWWSTYFDAQYLREYEPIFSAGQDRREAGRLIDLLALPVGSRVLDVPCGQGRHSRLLSEAGYKVDGVDYSPHLLKVARNHDDLTRYTRRDMRRLPAEWTGRFDAVVNLFTSFGFFTDPHDDQRVMHEFARVLRPGGTFVWHGSSRDGVMARFLERDWWTTDDGTVVAHERAFDPLSGILTVVATWRSPAAARRGLPRHGEREYRIRLYTATRLAELCATAGMIVERSYDDWTTDPLTRRTSSMTLVARKTPD
jgi:SAM-dependent methyltransferase